MIFARGLHDKISQLFSIDPIGKRAFSLSRFFEDALFLSAKDTPKTMEELIQIFDPSWTDHIAYFFGTQPELALDLSTIVLQAPIQNPPRNIVCLGKNYLAHAQELKGQLFDDKPPTHPIYFTKPEHCIVGTKERVLRHSQVTRRLDYEAELAVIIGKEGINIPMEKAEDYIFGYTIANDISARDLQKFHTQWFKGKSLSTHCPIGPWVVHKSQLPFPLSLDVRSFVNGDLRQEGNTRDLIFDIPTIISNLSQGYPLKPGDVILTGTPSGVGMAMDPPQYLETGDTVVCEIQDIGVLENTIADS